MSSPHTTWTPGPPSASRVPLNTASRPRDDSLPTELRLLSIKEIANTCQLSEKAVRRAIDEGELRAIKLRSRLRVTPQDFEAWITSSRRHSDRTIAAPRTCLARGAPAGTFRALIQHDHGASL